MKQKISESIEIPSGINCECKNNNLICKKDSLELSRKVNLPGIKTEIKDN